MTVSRLMAEMDIAEMYEWIALFNIEHEDSQEQDLAARAEAGAQAAKMRPR